MPEALIQHWLSVWLPRGFVVVVARSNPDLPIPDEDKAVVKTAVLRRRADFVSGRWCAHEGLNQLGLAARPLPVGAFGAPQWPGNVLGSITHDNGLCAAVVAHAQGLVGVGIDLCASERRATMAGLQHLLLSEHEATWLAKDAWSPRRLQLLFSAKESVVKAISTKMNRLIDLRDIEVCFDRRSFWARVKGLNLLVPGHWRFLQGHVLTAALIQASTKPR